VRDESMVLLRCAFPVLTLVVAFAFDVKAVDVACLAFLCQTEAEDAVEQQEEKGPEAFS